MEEKLKLYIQGLKIRIERKKKYQTSLYKDRSVRAYEQVGIEIDQMRLFVGELEALIKE